MDYYINDGTNSYLIETHKLQIREHIIDQYIALRKAKGLSQEQVANRSGIARTNIVRIESKRNTPTIEVLLKLAEALNMELEINFVEKSGGNDGK